MTFRELFDGIIKNKVPSLDIIDTVEKLADKKDGVTKKFLDQLLSDFSNYLQEYVDMILKKRESDTVLIEEYQKLKETDEVGVNFYLIQEYYDDAGLKVYQRNSILRFWTMIYNSIEHAEYLMSDKVTMGDSIGDSYRKGTPNSFFYEVYSQPLSDLTIYTKVKELTGNFDPVKIDLLCKDFDLYFSTEHEFWLGSFSEDEIDQRMEKLRGEGKKIPMLGDRKFYPSSVSEFFKPKRKHAIKRTKEQDAKLEKMLLDWQEEKKTILDLERLMDPHGIEFYSLHKLRNLLVDLKLKHTDDEPKYGDRKTIKRTVQPIHWLKEEESLRIFIDELKSAGMIENVETEKIIQEHFSQSDQKPQPIKWRQTNRLVIYLFNKLSEAGLIDSMDRQFQLITEHFLNKKGQPFKRDSLKSESSSMRTFGDPRGSEIIDSIIRKLTPLQ